MRHPDPRWCARIEAPKAAPRPVATPFRLRSVPVEHDCECCGARMFDRHCKIVCPNCGYKRDCSDP